MLKRGLHIFLQYRYLHNLNESPKKIFYCLNNNIIFVECRKGYFGDFCDEPCPAGFFGFRCGGKCFPKCSIKDCNHVSGCSYKNEYTSKTSYKGTRHNYTKLRILSMHCFDASHLKIVGFFCRGVYCRRNESTFMYIVCHIDFIYDKWNRHYRWQKNRTTQKLFTSWWRYFYKFDPFCNTFTIIYM